MKALNSSNGPVSAAPFKLIVKIQISIMTISRSSWISKFIGFLDHNNSQESGNCETYHVSQGLYFPSSSPPELKVVSSETGRKKNRAGKLDVLWCVALSISVPSGSLKYAIGWAIWPLGENTWWRCSDLYRCLLEPFMSLGDTARGVSIEESVEDAARSAVSLSSLQSRKSVPTQRQEKESSKFRSGPFSSSWQVYWHLELDGRSSTTESMSLSYSKSWWSITTWGSP